MEKITFSVGYVWDFSKEQVAHNRGLALTVLAIASLTVIAHLYKRIYSSDSLLFNRNGIPLTPEEVNDLTGVSQIYSPTELANRLLAYINDPSSEIPEGQLKKISLKKDIDLPIFPHPSTPPLSLEDERATMIQSWAMSLQPLFALLNDSPISWKQILQPIQASPRLASTLLFNCLAPFAAQSIWGGVKDFLPASILEIGHLYLEHKGKVAIASLGLIAWAYYKMNQEKGILTNLTENFALCQYPHRGLDLVSSYKSGITELLRTIGMTTQIHTSYLCWIHRRSTC
jgi:hypothetical protein